MNTEEIISQLIGLKEHCHSMIDKEEPESIWRYDEEALQYAIDLLSGKGENLLALLKLMQENPELPVVPMVDSEIVCDDGYARWLGAWGSSYIGEYLITKEQVRFREDDDMYEIEMTLEEQIGSDAFGGMSDDEAKKAYAALPWVKAIILNIDQR